MENYKKKYEEIIENIKEAKEKMGGYTFSSVVDKIISELKESEDERIRKELISLFKDCIEGVNHRYTGSDSRRWLAWLEKQGEQKNIEGTFINVDEIRENFVKEVYRVLSNDTTNDRANDIIYYFDSLPTIYLHTNKPLAPDGDDFDMDDILKNHAWSEDDEKNYESAIWHIEKSCGKNGNVYNWLKSLKDRYTWKPSDEQMKFLWKYAEQNNYDGTILASLYQDLKKLKGE